MSKNEVPTWELTWEDWVNIGNAFKKLDAYLLKASVYTRPKSSPEAKKFTRLLNNFGKVRCELDNLVCAKYGKEKGDIVTSVFYGRNEVKPE
jgi:hypothetical protein